LYLYDVDLPKLWAFDLETDGLKPTVIHCAVAENVGTGDVHELVGQAAILDWLGQVPSDHVFVGHNFMAFDRWVLASLAGFTIPPTRVVDTLVLSYLYNPYLDGGHSLESYGSRLGSPKIGHEDWTKFSPEMLARCRQDAHLTVLTYQALAGRMRGLGFSEKSCEIEHLFADVIAEQGRNGFWFDVDRATSLLSDLRQAQSDLSKQIQEIFPPRLTPVKNYPLRRRKDGSLIKLYASHVERYDALEHHDDDTYTVYSKLPFNIASPKQRIERLTELGWEPTEFTEPSKTHPKGQPKVNEDELLKFATLQKDDRIAAIAKYLVLNARCGMLENWLSFVESDHRIHGKVWACGARTRRCRHDHPNTATIPSEAKRGSLCGRVP
jgi:DNA polymerase-1